MSRHEVSDEEWALVGPFLRSRKWRPGGKGRPPGDQRKILNGILWVLETGAPWRDVPEKYGPWQTVYLKFSGWRKEGTWQLLVEGLLGKMVDEGRLNVDLWAIDGSYVRSTRSAAGAGKRGAPMNPTTTNSVAKEAASTS